MLDDRTSYSVFAVSMALLLLGCSTIPRHYIRMAEPGVTLTAVTTHPEQYRGKVVILGGVIVEEKDSGDFLWLRMKNRPLDENNIPHRPIHTDDREAGCYWVILSKKEAPPPYHRWARMTVVGRVTGEQQAPAEPVLLLLYVRGWGMNSVHDGAWEDTVDANYFPSVPAGAGREYDPGR